MTRLVAAGIALSLFAASAPPAAWAQAAASARVASVSRGAPVVSGAAASLLPGRAAPAVAFPSAAAALSPAFTPLPAVIAAPAAARAEPAPVSADAASLARAKLDVLEESAALAEAASEGARSGGARVMDHLLGAAPAPERGADEPVAGVAAPRDSGLSAPSRSRQRLKPASGPPLASLGRAPAVQPPLSRIAAALSRFWRVLPDKERNRQFWVLTIAQSLIRLGVAFHYTALPGLVAPAKEEAAKIGYNRAANWGAQAAASVLTGPFIDRRPVKATIVWTNLARSGLMFLVPILFFHGALGFAGFTVLVAAAGFLQMAGMTAETVAFNRILGEDEARYNKANAVATIFTNAVGVAGPLLAGAFVAWIDGAFGLAAGNALSYAVYGALLLAAGLGLALMLSLPREKRPPARSEKKGPPRRVLGELVEGLKVIFTDRYLFRYLLVSTLAIMAGDALVFAALPRFLEDVLAAGAGSFGLFLAASALGGGVGSGLMAFVRDPEKTGLLPASRLLRSALAEREPGLGEEALDAAARAFRGAASSVLARYRSEPDAAPRSAAEFSDDVLREASQATGKALDRSPEEAAALLEASGAASEARAWAAGRGAEFAAQAAREAKGGMDRLQRQARWTSWLHGLSWLAYAALFFTGSLYGSAALMLLSALLAGPEIVVWASLTTRVVAGSYPDSQGKVYSAIYLYQLLCAIGGVLLFGGLMAVLPTMTVLKIAAAVMGACAAIDLIAPAWIFPLRKSS